MTMGAQKVSTALFSKPEREIIPPGLHEPSEGERETQKFLQLQRKTRRVESHCSLRCLQESLRYHLLLPYPDASATGQEAAGEIPDTESSPPHSQLT